MSAEALEDGGIHAVTFTSSSTVTNLLKVLKGMGVADPVELLKGSTIACIGPLTAQTAEEAGLHVSSSPRKRRSTVWLRPCAFGTRTIHAVLRHNIDNLLYT